MRRLKICPRTDTSRAEAGSSRKMTLGPTASARGARQPHLVEEASRLSVLIWAVPDRVARWGRVPQGVPDRRADREHRIERSEGALEHHLDGKAVLTPSLGVQCRHGATTEAD